MKLKLSNAGKGIISFIMQRETREMDPTNLFDEEIFSICSNDEDTHLKLSEFIANKWSYLGVPKHHVALSG